jgi:hypothetical protein
MPIQQREAPCWQPCAPGKKPSNEGPHWGTAEKAAPHADPGETPQPFPSPCWVATCDGLPGIPCGMELEDDDEGWIIHAENPADLPNFASYEGWETKEDGTIQCAECVDDELQAAEAKP